MSASNPLGLANWRPPTGNGGDDAEDTVELGRFNQLKDDDGRLDTTIQNTAEQNPAIVGQNINPGVGVVGVFGQSNGGGGAGVGVIGACDTGWGVAGVATSSDLDVLNELAPPGDPTATLWPTNAGVFGVGDMVGIYGQSKPRTPAMPPGTGQAPSDKLLTPGNVSGGIGVYGIGDVVGVIGESDTGRGGMFGSANPNIAQVNLEPALNPSPALPPSGSFGDLYVTVTGGDAAPATAQMFLCVTPGDGVSTNAMWAAFMLAAPVPGG